MFCVYLLQSQIDGNKYIGSTNDINRRLDQHNTGQVLSTRLRKPFTLIGYQQCKTLTEARLLEKKYKHSHGSLESAIKRNDFIINGM